MHLNTLTQSLTISLALMLAGSMPMAADNLSQMESHFRNVPDSQPLAVYWYWMAGNISRDGVVKDLQAMKRAGINRAQIGIIGEGQGAPKGPVKTFSAAWWDVLHQALKTAGDLGIEIGIFNCPGWSQSGGPWVKAGQAMRYLAAECDTVSGPQTLTLTLRPHGEEQDVRVLAYPLKEGKARLSCVGDLRTATELVYTSSGPVTLRSVYIQPAAHKGKLHVTLEVDRNGSYESVKEFDIDRSNPALNVGFMPYAPVAVSLPETRGQRFRVRLSKAGSVSQVVLSDVPRVERFAEKSLAKMWQTPHPMFDAYMWPSQPDYSASMIVQPAEVKDLSGLVDTKGVLRWRVPQGRWVVERAMMRPTGTVNSPAPADATGYETDKMSRTHIRAHFDAYLGEILRRIPPEDRKTFKIVVEDSYETGGQNWTDSLVADFRRAYGYDPVPYIPVLSGTVVGSEEQSDRFLWDLRRLVADEVAYQYVGGLREISHEHGLTTWLENYGHWGFPGEFLQYGGQSDEVAGEFWSFGDLGNIENRCASSCAHIYGKPKTWAESFTCGGPDFTQYPGQMKQRGDRFFTEGINATLLHLYIQQPADSVPGVNAWFGNEFNRHNTWFSQFDVFARYLKRCNYMLQQGRYVADVAYFIGEDAPKMTGRQDPALPAGYSFDYVNAEVIRQAFVMDGRLVLQSGMSYGVLVLPRMKTMRPALLRKIKDLVAQGAIILGPAPDHSPSLQDYPQADNEVRSLAAQLWGRSTGEGRYHGAYGKGQVFSGYTLEEVLDTLGLVPDFRCDQVATPVLFIHQRLSDGDYYFVSNQSDKVQDFTASFRIGGRQPELWNPLEAAIRLLPQYSSDGRLTRVPLHLEPYESSFIVFRTEAQSAPRTGVNYPEPRPVTTLEAPWTVTFEPGHGGPEKPVTLKSLSDWTTSKDNRIKYFSGRATYTTSFKLSALPAGETYLDLGQVMVMARVKLNGHDVGGVWTSPYRVDVTRWLKRGRNRLEVEVVNCWHNRIIGDLALPRSQRITHQSVTALKTDTPLQPSGLMGPVKLLTYDYIIKY